MSESMHSPYEDIPLMCDIISLFCDINVFQTPTIT